MKAAITAASRGHKVTLAEKTDTLGGLLKFTDYDSLKVDLMRYKNHLIHMTQSMPIDIEYNTEVTSEYDANKQPDAINIAHRSPLVFQVLICLLLNTQQRTTRISASSATVSLSSAAASSAVKPACSLLSSERLSPSSRCRTKLRLKRTGCTKKA